MTVLHLLDFAHNLVVSRLLFKICATHSLDIVKLSVTGTLSPFVLAFKLIDFVLNTFGLSSDFASLLVKFVFLSANFHHLLAASFKLTLDLLQISSLLEKVLRGMATLILQNLLPLKVGTVGTLLEFTTVVIITHLQMS